MNVENYSMKLKHYLADLSDDADLIDEAIASLEGIFELRQENELLHFSRPEAVAYLALKSVVRCEDCKHWLPMNRFVPDYHPGRGQCELNCWVRDFDWFCADGRRKSD